MNKIRLYTGGLIVSLLFALRVDGQVVFEEGGFTEVLQKAGQENKLVFMDCYTSWCGPCKKMLKDVFSREDVGVFMNSRFVNYKKDMEKEDGKELTATYQVKAYPTFLILDAQGNVRHRIVGGMVAEKFLEEIQKGMGENSLSAFSSRYANGERETEFVRQYIELLAAAYMRDELKEILSEYWDALSDVQKSGAENWALVKRFVTDVKSPEYQYLLEHKADFEAVSGKEAVDAKIFGDLCPRISNHCNDMIFKNCPEDPQALLVYRQLIEKSGVQRQGYLLNLVAFTQAYVDNHLEKALKIYCDDFSREDDDTRFSATLGLNGMLISKGDARLCRKGLKAIRRTMKECGWTEDNPLFEAMINGLKNKQV